MANDDRMALEVVFFRILISGNSWAITQPHLLKLQKKNVRTLLYMPSAKRIHTMCIMSNSSYALLKQHSSSPSPRSLDLQSVLQRLLMYGTPKIKTHSRIISLFCCLFIFACSSRKIISLRKCSFCSRSFSSCVDLLEITNETAVWVLWLLKKQSVEITRVTSWKSSRRLFCVGQNC